MWLHLLEIGQVNLTGSDHASSISRALAFFFEARRNAACSRRSSSSKSSRSKTSALTRT